MKKYTRILIGSYLLTSILSTTGCQPSSSTDTQEVGHGHDHGHDHHHDHSDRPKSLRAAIEELRKLGDELRVAMEKDDADAAHEPLHHVGKLLKTVPDLAADTDLPETDWEVIKTEADRLFKAFGEVDLAFHKKDGDKQAAYDSVKSTIDDGLAALEGFLPKLGDFATSTKHDHHDDHDHEDHTDNEHDEHDDHEHQEHDHDDDAKTE